MKKLSDLLLHLFSVSNKLRIAGRGMLLDWAGWAETQNTSYSAFAASLQCPFLGSTTDEDYGGEESQPTNSTLWPPGKGCAPIGLCQEICLSFAQVGRKDTEH